MNTHAIRCCTLFLVLAANACGTSSSPDVTDGALDPDVADGPTNPDAAEVLASDDGLIDSPTPSDNPTIDAPAPTDSPSSDTPAARDVVDSGIVGTDVPANDAATMFPVGTICNASGSRRAPPAHIGHVIVIMLENKSFASVQGNASAPYYNSLVAQCGYSTQFLDNMFDADLVSEPHYFGLVSGSNCNTGVGDTTQSPGSTGCITDDADPNAHTLATTTVFSQVASWRAYNESMPSACFRTSTGSYACKHNPALYYTTLNAVCSANDVPIAHVNCPTTRNTTCAAPNNALSQDLANDTLPALAFVTPDEINDMHTGTVAQGDNWLHTYLPLVFASAAYRRGDVAVYLLWDEAAAPPDPTPNLFISPYVAPVVSGVPMNLFAALRAIEDQLGIATHLGCAGGTPPGGVGTCAAGSTADLRAVFNM